MQQIIEVPLPLFTATITSHWDRDTDEDRYHCAILAGPCTIYEKTYTTDSATRDEADIEAEFLADVAERARALFNN